VCKYAFFLLPRVGGAVCSGLKCLKWQLYALVLDAVWKHDTVKFCFTVHSALHVSRPELPFFYWRLIDAIYVHRLLYMIDRDSCWYTYSYISIFVYVWICQLIIVPLLTSISLTKFSVRLRRLVLELLIFFIWWITANPFLSFRTQVQHWSLLSGTQWCSRRSLYCCNNIN
jgi:hypothetical protein